MCREFDENFEDIVLIFIFSTFYKVGVRAVCRSVYGLDHLACLPALLMDAQLAV